MRFGLVNDLIRAHEEAENPVMLWSPPGVGKSSLVKQLCDDDGIKNIDIRLSLLNPVDLRGIPVVQGDKVVWVPPVFLVKQGPCRFFCDEINVAPPATQACAYQWFLDKKIGEWAMDLTPMKTKAGNTRPAQTILGAGNRATDQAFVHQMPAPLRNRVAHIEVEPNFEDWREWAYKAGIHRYVINYLTYTARVGVDIKGVSASETGLLFFFDPKQHAAGSFPTPRSWEMVSRFITRSPKYRTNTEAVAGMVSASVASSFTAFVKVADELPNAEEVLAGKDAKPPTEPSAKYAFCGALAASLIRAKKEDRVKATQNVAAYCVNRWGDDAEFAVLTMKDFGRTPEYKEIYRSVIVSKEWTQFTKTFGDLLES
jgi:hypothetical protein